MGVVKRAVYDKIIDSAADRNANRLRVYQKDNGEVVIHVRNLKITLITTAEIVEWVEGFREAVKKVRERNLLPNDL